MLSSSSSIDETLYHYSVLTLFLIASPNFIALRFLQAPYGKHHRPGWGPTISPSVAWFLMESPTLWLTLSIFPFGQHSTNPKSLILISPYLIHYFNRTIIYPLKLHLKSRKPTGFPVSVACIGFVFNVLNAYVQARWVSEYNVYDDDGEFLFWLRVCVGLVVFFCGMSVNVWADGVLVGLKSGGGGGGMYYRVPRGGLFEYVSCPNYFGEAVEWFGWAVMTWSSAGLGFFVYSCANLVGRARANHLWYLDKFGEDYPKCRKSVIPFVY